MRTGRGARGLRPQIACRRDLRLGQRPPIDELVRRDVVLVIELPGCDLGDQRQAVRGSSSLGLRLRRQRRDQRFIAELPQTRHFEHVFYYATRVRHVASPEMRAGDQDTRRKVPVGS